MTIAAIALIGVYIFLYALMGANQE